MQRKAGEHHADGFPAARRCSDVQFSSSIVESSM